MIYYKTIDTNLWDIKGWIVAADTIEDALGLANKRSEGNNIKDIKQIGSTTVVLGTSKNYQDVVNMRERLNVL